METNESKGDVALYAKQFKGACRVCGKIGHKAENCWDLDKKEAFLKKNKNGKGKGKSKDNITCWHCGKKGHYSNECKNKKKDKKEDSTTDDDNADVVLMAKENLKCEIGEKNLWIADSGATSHMVNSMQGLTNVKSVSERKVAIGDGTFMNIDKVGDWQGWIVKEDGSKVAIKIQDVVLVKGLKCNLFSITAMLNKGWKLQGDKNGVKIKKGSVMMVFDKVIKSTNGYLLGKLMVPRDESATTEVSMIANDAKTLHDRLGHPGRAILKETMEKMGFAAKIDDFDCESCKVAKAKQMNLNKVNEKRSTTVCERLGIDISSVKVGNTRMKRFWLFVVDEATGMKWSFFLKKKSDQVDVLVDHVKDLQKAGKKVKFIRCDNAGENYKFEDAAKKEKLGLEFEFTARNTPQQNGQVERAFAATYGRMRAMMHEAGIHGDERKKYWVEAAATATKVGNLLVNDRKSKCAHEKVYGTMPKFARHLRTFGEHGVMTKASGKIQNKLEDRGIKVRFVGYARNHAGNVYRMMDPVTQKVYITRDVTWLSGSNEEKEVQVVEDDDVVVIGPSDGEEEADGVQNSRVDGNGNENDMEKEPAMETVEPPKKIPRELLRLQDHNNPGRLELEGSELCFLVSDDDPEKQVVRPPLTFREAWDHEDPHERKLWREAIREEFHQMILKGVWRKKGVKGLPDGRIGIGTKWVFALKKDGRHRARLVAKGYDQVAGIDFFFNFAPVMTDVTLRVLLCLWISNEWYAIQGDVKTAFLNGELEEEIYIEIPDGYMEYLKESKEKIEGDHLKLEKALYGLVQAARAWWRKFTTHLIKVRGFEQFGNDGCLFVKRNGAEMVILGLYVDDFLLLGEKENVQRELDELKSAFEITCGEVEEFIGCVIEKYGDRIMLSQPDIIERLMRKFEHHLSGKQFKTPAAGGSRVMRPTVEIEKLGRELQQEYRSGVGSLLYLVKQTRPDISNQTRELSKVMDGASKEHWKMLLRTISYIRDTKGYKLEMKPNKTGQFKWEIKAFSDSDYAGDSDGRKSVSGYVIFLNGMPVAWRSKQQRSVTLSSTEAEYVAVSEVMTEILFIREILEFLGVEIDFPILVHVDNIGAIYLAQQAGTSIRTKHVDTRYHFVREYIEDGVVKVIFVKSEDNDADLMTKNLADEKFQKHSEKLMKLDMMKK